MFSHKRTLSWIITGCRHTRALLVSIVKNSEVPQGRKVRLDLKHMEKSRHAAVGVFHCLNQHVLVPRFCARTAPRAFGSCFFRRKWMPKECLFRNNTEQPMGVKQHISLVEGDSCCSCVDASMCCVRRHLRACMMTTCAYSWRDCRCRLLYQDGNALLPTPFRLLSRFYPLSLLGTR